MRSTKTKKGSKTFSLRSTALTPLLLILIPFLLIWLSAAASPPESDHRELVTLPPMMQQHMLGNMRDHLLAIAQIQEALADDQLDAAAKIAEERIGLSSLQAHGAAHMAPYMPERMRAIGTQMHRAASELALAAQEASVDGELAPVLRSLSKVTRQCIACHAAYRIH